MSVFKRLSATLFSHVDRAVSEIENHDAIIEAAIRDQQRALAKAKVRLNRLRAEGRKLEKRLSERDHARVSSPPLDEDRIDGYQLGVEPRQSVLVTNPLLTVFPPRLPS